MEILDILNKYLNEAKAGDTVKSKKGKTVEVEGSQKGREKVKVNGKEYTPEDKYVVKVKDAKGEVKEKTKRKAAKYSKYVDKVKEKEPSRVSNTKEAEKAKKKESGETKRGKKKVDKWWENSEELNKVIGIDVEAKKKTKEAINKIREKDDTKETPKKKKIAENIYPKNPKAVNQIIEEFLNPQKDEVRKFFK